ncbi:hypothetical protein V8C86DRAFT_692553 [Haematococcus lacustris]
MQAIVPVIAILQYLTSCWAIDISSLYLPPTSCLAQAHEHPPSSDALDQLKARSRALPDLTRGDIGTHDWPQQPRPPTSAAGVAFQDPQPGNGSSGGLLAITKAPYLGQCSENMGVLRYKIWKGGAGS